MSFVYFVTLKVAQLKRASLMFRDFRFYDCHLSDSAMQRRNGERRSGENAFNNFEEKEVSCFHYFFDVASI